MTDAEKLELAKQDLKFCPVCGGPIEQHPNDPTKVSCYNHGDFLLSQWIDGEVAVAWLPLMGVAV